jgi:E3 ubiquitin-protein ligase RNF14
MASIASYLLHSVGSFLKHSLFQAPSPQVNVKQWKCGICLESFSESQKADFSSAPFQCRKHFFCNQCLSNFFSYVIKEGSLEEMICPDPECHRRHPRAHLVRERVSEEIFERYLNLSFNRYLEKLPNITYCPKCTAPVCVDDDGQFYGHCAGCDYCFCVNCEKDWHRPGYCTKARAMDPESMEWFKNVTKHCPNCDVAIEKNQGCDHMHCVRCNTHFQWSLAPYSIYSEGNRFRNMSQTVNAPQAGNYNNNPVRSQASRPSRQPIVKLAKKPTPAKPKTKTKACSHCGRFQERPGNSNHILCKVCRNHFCFQCGVAVKGMTHFSAGPCKQHVNEIEEGK